VTNFLRYPKRVVCSTAKAKTPATYARIHKAVVVCAILLPLTADGIDLGRQSATSHKLKTSARIEKMECEAVTANFKGELKYICKELLLMGDIDSTAEKLTNAAATTTIIVISCAR